MESILEKVTTLYDLKGFEFSPVPEHEGGRNRIYICSENGEKKRVLRLSAFGDRSLEDYLAETAFIAGICSIWPIPGSTEPAGAALKRAPKSAWSL